jgi:hypothetical protein
LDLNENCRPLPRRRPDHQGPAQSSGTLADANQAQATITPTRLDGEGVESNSVILNGALDGPVHLA